ncbi:hypothetical protein BDK51DRAFT_26137, partial [Blyttiomyces helicus]
MKEDIESPPKEKDPKFIDHQKTIRYGWLSFLFASWLDPLMRLGYRRPLKEMDLYAMREKDRAAELLHILDPFWDGVRASLADPSVPMPSLFAVFRRHFFFTWVLSCILKGLSIACTLSVPTFVQQILNWLQKDPEDPPFMSSGVGLAFCLFALNVGGSLFG